MGVFFGRGVLTAAPFVRRFFLGLADAQSAALSWHAEPFDTPKSARSIVHDVDSCFNFLGRPMNTRLGDYSRQKYMPMPWIAR